MKVYISGKISGLPIQEAKERFDNAQALLESCGLDPVNPMSKEMPENATWEQHMVKDIELLLRCDAIYLMDNWADSRGAQIEYDIANRMKLEFIFESDYIYRNKEVFKIQSAIHEVMGIRLCEYNTKSRNRDFVFARMIFVYQCRRKKMKLTQIAKYVHRDHSSMLHLLNKYNDEVRYNPQFRNMAARVDNILNKTTK
ncbi:MULTISPECIES: DUF4406 domain-containing protein [Bacteroidales]|uniref:DUF4406 domain-containing protein n=1 Tax=Bacteroides pyogenes TaxID=310300 RepID=UPI002F924781